VVGIEDTKTKEQDPGLYGILRLLMIANFNLIFTVKYNVRYNEVIHKV
jgi:hypothetical protein